ncbi:MAG: hypothetical protein IKR08_07445 [Firmicutes bacterium]|nr:hypothetical protein [Bacillota bacterium]
MSFDLGSYIKNNERTPAPKKKHRSGAGFEELCRKVSAAFMSDWESDGSADALELQKKAIIGYEKEKAYFIRRIEDLCARFGALDCEYPQWYPSLAEAVYQENWGLAGLSEWFGPRFSDSSSAKLIGENIYFMENGRMRLMPQKISRRRTEQLIRALLLLNPEERMDKSYYELYLLDGTRVTVFTEPMAKKAQAGLIFRRYLIPSLTFEEQAKRNTIPACAVPLLKNMAAVGYNVVFMGPVRSAKTTFLSTWQSCEDPSLEGVMVETDPEIPMHKILPGAPILQLIADGDELRRISKSLLRSDADYFILAEARDGIALDTAVRIASKGTKRMKLTFHSRRPDLFPLEAATEIVKATGGDLHLTMKIVSNCFDLIFHLVQLPDKSQKRLRGIYCMNCREDGSTEIRTLCSYDASQDSWTFYDDLGEAQKIYGEESGGDAYRNMCGQLKELAERSPVKNDIRA